MKSIEEYANYLFNCCFTDAEDHEDHLKMSWELFDNYAWLDIYPVWIQYLHAKCEMPEDVINFVNLYVYYEVADQTVPNPVEFLSYLYFKIDMEKYWDEAGELFDGLAVNIFSRQGLVNIMENPYYSPLKDERILSDVAAWKNK